MLSRSASRRIRHAFLSLPTVFKIFLYFPRTEHCSQLVESRKSSFMLKVFMLSSALGQETRAFVYSILQNFSNFSPYNDPMSDFWCTLPLLLPGCPDLLMSKTSSKNVIGHKSLSTIFTLCRCMFSSLPSL